MLEERLASGREQHAARGAQEELGSELVFEVAYLPTHRRLGDVQLGGGSAHVAVVGDGDEVLDLREAHALESRSKRYWTPSAVARIFAG